jgi:FMN reductase
VGSLLTVRQRWAHAHDLGLHIVGRQTIISPVALPLIVGVGGSPRPGSLSERALLLCLRTAEELGAVTERYTGAALELPMFDPVSEARTPECQQYLDSVRRADGLIIATPGYHGSLSGRIKNALDFTEDLKEDVRPYLEGRAVACVACAAGWQAAVTTLSALRDVVHALRGWPTPLGVAVNSQQVAFDIDGGCRDPGIESQLRIATEQVVSFASMVAARAELVAK